MKKYIAIYLYIILLFIILIHILVVVSISSDSDESTSPESKSIHTVRFLDSNGNVISAQLVSEGESAIAPERTPQKAASDGYYYVFKEWDKSFTNVTEQLTISPVFTKHKLPNVQESESLTP